MLFIPNIIISQVPVKMVTVLNEDSPNTEIFYVKKNEGDGKIKHGEYSFKYLDNVQVHGSYKNNIKTGKWEYTPDKSCKIIGFYKNDLKDSIWTYYINKVKVSEINYKKGKMDELSLSYYSNGTIKLKTNYVDGSKEGITQLYYEDGTTHINIHYLNDKCHGDYLVFSDKGDTLCCLKYQEGIPFDLNLYNQDENILYVDGDLKDGNGKLTKFYPKYERSEDGGNIRTKEKSPAIIAEFKEGKLHGQVIVYSMITEKPVSRGNYEMGQIVNEWMFYDSKNKEWKSKDITDISDSLMEEHIKLLALHPEFEYSGYHVDDMPKFNNDRAEIGFREYIAKNLNYPDLAAENGISGKVLVRFSINSIGEIGDIIILRGIHYTLDSEVLRLMNNSPYWVPGFVNGIPVKVQFVFPVSFVLHTQKRRR